MKLVESVTALDQFGLEIKLKFNNKEKQKSFIGGLLSLFIMILIALASYNLISTVILRTGVEVSTSKEFRKEPQNLNIIDYNHTFRFQLQKAGKVLPVDDALNHVTIKGSVLRRSYDEASNSVVLSNYFEFDYKACKEVKNSIMDNYFKRHSDPSVRAKTNTFQMCPDLKDSDIPNFEVGGNPMFADDYRVILLHVYPCVSGLGRQCAAASEYTSLVSPLRIPRFTFEPDKVKNPVSEVDVFDNMGVELRRVTVYNFTLQQEVIQDESIFNFWGTTEKARFLDIESRAIDGTIRKPPTSDCTMSPGTGMFGISCDPLLSVTFQIGGTVIHQKRNFGKILNTFGEVGGMFEIIMIVFGAIFLCFKCYTKSEKQIIKEAVLEEDELEEILDFNKRYETGFENNKFKHKVVDDMLEEIQDGSRIFKDSQKMKILDQVVFKEYHKKLLLLVIYRMKTQEKIKTRMKKIEKVEKNLTLEAAFEQLKSDESGLDAMTIAINRHFLEVLGQGEGFPKLAKTTSLRKAREPALVLDEEERPQSSLIRPRYSSSNKVHPFEVGTAQKQPKQAKKSIFKKRMLQPN